MALSKNDNRNGRLLAQADIENLPVECPLLGAKLTSRTHAAWQSIDAGQKDRYRQGGCRCSIPKLVNVFG
jgi:hypothetical protein